MVHVSSISFYFSLLGFPIPQVPTCRKPLGMENGVIPNSVIQASSQLNIHYAPENARLNYKGTTVGGVRYGCWIPLVSNHNQWLQVDFGTQTQVTGISIQGCYHADYWVKKFSLRYSNDGSNFYHYQPDSYTQVKDVPVK